MTLNELIPPEKWHEMTHNDNHNFGESYADFKARAERIKLYAPAVLRCIRECGLSFNLSESVEVNMVLSTLACVDHALAQIKKQ